MTQSELETGSPRVNRPANVDQWLNIGVIVLLMAVLAGAGYFGYTIYRDRLIEDQSSATGRIAAALGDQVRKTPNDAVLRVRYGEALGAMGKYQQAIDQFNAATKIDPKHTGAYLDLGMVAQLTKNLSAAEGYYLKVITLTDGQDYAGVNPVREQAYFNLGTIMLDQKRFADSAGYFKAALQIRSDASDTYYSLAKDYQGLGDADAAIQQLNIAVQFDPGYAEAHYLLGELYQGKQDIVNATAEYSKAASDAPTADPPKQALESFGPASDWVTKAQQALGTGDTDTALTDAQIAINLDASNFAAAKLKGQILVERGSLKDALAAYQAAALLNPKDAEVKQAIATLTPQVKALTPQKSAAVKKAAAKKSAAKKKAAAKKVGSKKTASTTATATGK
jgi:tetratricopeptide (TPR) repeat protein